MFADSLLESPWADRSRRSWTTVFSFAGQSLGLGILLLVPLLFTEALPRLQLIQAIAPPAPPPGPPPSVERHGSSAQHPSNLLNGITIVAPQTIPDRIAVFDESAPPPTGVCTYCVPGGTGPMTSDNPVFGALGTGRAFVTPPPKPSAPPPRVSRMMEGNLIYRPQPVYPSIARSARVQGTVILRAIISRDGTIENLQVISGPPMLVRAALDAVRQWRYRPYMLNGEPVEVETQVTVNFLLAGG